MVGEGGQELCVALARVVYDSLTEARSRRGLALTVGYLVRAMYEVGLVSISACVHVLPSYVSDVCVMD